MNELNFDLHSIELDIQNIAREARKDALLEMEQDIRFPEIIQVFQNVCNRV
jgi:hypothetical protein